MRATVTKTFAGVKDGEVYPRDFLPGDEVEGDLARTAVAAGNADGDGEDEGAPLLRRAVQPLPPQPNNPPSPAAIGQAGLPPAQVMLSSPAPGTEPAVPAAATVDGGASTVEGPGTPSGGKSEDVTGEGRTASELRNDGPTVAEYVAAGYRADQYPPLGYGSRSTPEEIKAAIASQDGGREAKDAGGAPENKARGRGKAARAAG